jgi:hypothetical protein
LIVLSKNFLQPALAQAFVRVFVDDSPLRAGLKRIRSDLSRGLSLGIGASLGGAFAREMAELARAPVPQWTPLQKKTTNRR